jgi:hypothetical protein
MRTLLLGLAAMGLFAPRAGVAAATPAQLPIVPVPRVGPLPADRPDPVTRPLAAAPLAQSPTGTWEPLGPAPIGPSALSNGLTYGGSSSGRITAVDVIPSGAHAGRIVAGSAGGGIWTSDDGGATWTARSDSAPNLAIGALTIDPADANHLIAGTGEANQCGDCFAGAGLLVSTDGGTTWTSQNPGGVFTGKHIAALAVDPSNPSQQFAATDGGLYVTSNGGVSWAKPSDASYTSVDGDVTAVVIDPTAPATVYIGGGAKTVAKSTDGGVTWAAANTGIAAPGATPLIALAIAASSPSTLYASAGSQSPVVLYKTTDRGGSWSLLSTAPDFTGNVYAYGHGSTGEQGWYDNVIAVDPTSPDHVLAGGETVVETTDGGTTWTNVNGQAFFDAGTNKLHPDQHALAFTSDGSRVWIGDDGGAFDYTPASGTVANANGNLNVTQFYYGFDVVGGTLLAGAQDNATARTNSSSLSAWTGIWSGDGGPSQITPNSPQIQYIESNRHLYVSTDGFASTRTDITPPQAGQFTPPELVVQNNATPGDPTVFYGGPDLYRTTATAPASPSWQTVTTVGTTVSAIAASADGQTVYAGFTNGTIQVSTDGGATFTSVAAPTLSGDKFVTGISVDPTNSKAIVASFSSGTTRFRPGLPHVQQFSWTTSPALGSWTDITGSGLPAAVSRVIYDNGALIAATDSGVYATAAVSGSSTSWTTVGSGLPNVQVQDLYLAGSTIYAVTHGRGAWMLPTAPQNGQSPTIAGTAEQGQALTVTQGTWSNASTVADQWQDCDSAGNNCANIAGATGSSYTLATSDVGHTIRVLETATNSNGSSQISSAATAVVLPLPPGNTDPPAISGTAQRDHALTLSQGAWSNHPTSIADQWQDCDSAGANCANIAGATGSSYTLAASDMGHTIRVSETASNAGGSGGPVSSQATSPVLPAAPGNATPPSVSGVAQQGRLLSATQGVWSNTPTTVSEQWQDCDSAGNNCANIVGATGSSYTLAAADVGHTIRVAETAANAGGAGGPVSSEVTGVVVPLPPGNTGLPAVSGTAQQGQPLTVTQGTWSNHPSSISDQWQDCDGAGANCAAIAGATGSTYTLAASDVGRTIRVAELATNAGGRGGPASSAATGVVAPQTGSPAVQAVRVSGATVRVKLSCSGGPCQVKLILTASGPGKRGKPHPVTVGAAAVTIAGGQTATIRVSLNGAGRRLLRQRHRLTSRLLIRQGGRIVSRKTVTFRANAGRAANRSGAGRFAQAILHF